LDEAYLDVLENKLTRLEDEVNATRRRLKKLRRQMRKGDTYGQVESLEWVANFAVHIKTQGKYLRETADDALEVARLRYQRLDG
jgi:predicted  nucleic acid-binding Zn-ribbon protein